MDGFTPEWARHAVWYQMLPERFVFTGGVPNEDLAAYYRWADAYVSLSEHEGFCVPLVESMAMDVPVLAYAAGAVPETLGGAGARTRRRPVLTVGRFMKADYSQ